MYHTFCIHSSTDRLLHSFHFLATENNAAVNLTKQTSLCDPDFTSFVYIYTVVGLLDHCCVTHSVVSDSLRPHGLPRLAPGPWDSPGKNIGVGCHSLLQVLDQMAILFLIFLRHVCTVFHNSCTLTFSLTVHKNLFFFVVLPTVVIFVFLKVASGSDGKKHLPTMRDTRVQSLGQEDPLE